MRPTIFCLPLSLPHSMDGLWALSAFIRDGQHRARPMTGITPNRKSGADSGTDAGTAISGKISATDARILRLDINKLLVSAVVTGDSVESAGKTYDTDESSCCFLDYA